MVRDLLGGDENRKFAGAIVGAGVGDGTGVAAAGVGVGVGAGASPQQAVSSKSVANKLRI